MNLKVPLIFLFLLLGVSLIAPGDSAYEDNAVALDTPVSNGVPGFGDEDFNFDTSMFEAADQLDTAFSPQSTIDHPNFMSDETYIHTAIPELQNKDLDVDQFMNEFDRIDCSKYNGDKTDPLNVLCDNQLMNTAFGPLGEYNTDHNDFYKYLKDQIYQPLAYDISKRENLSDMVLDSVNLNQKNSLFYGQPLTSNYNKFEESILKIFEDIAGKTSDMEANKDVINELMISTLKRFHLYWNYLRYQNQFDKLKIDTKEVMKTILKTYLMKRDFLNYVAKTLIKGIIQAYYRFVRAHKMVEILNRYGPYLISSQIINRYKNFADRIQSSNFNNIYTVKEISYLISLLQVYHILSYKQGLPDATVQINFKTEIMLRIEREFMNYVTMLPQESQRERVRQIKEYTAVMLLKFKHITFIMFQYHGIAQYANMPQMNYIKSTFAVKIYYEMLDNMLMLPKSCVNFLLLKSCVIHETTKNLRYITTKYNIKRSTYGWYFLLELSAMMKNLYSKANSQTWEQWSNFKNYYYSNLFSVMYTYKKLFQVADMDSVDDLETLLGSVIDQGKKMNQLKPFDFGLIDSLDKDMYNEFLSIKADYNSYAPVEKDPTILNFLRVRIHKFLANFVKEHINDLNPEFHAIIGQVKEALDKWIREIPNKPQSVVAVSTMNTHPEFQQIAFDQLGVEAPLQAPSNEPITPMPSQEEQSQQYGGPEFLPAKLIGQNGLMDQGQFQNAQPQFNNQQMQFDSVQPQMGSIPPQTGNIPPQTGNIPPPTGTILPPKEPVKSPTTGVPAPTTGVPAQQVQGRLPENPGIVGVPIVVPVVEAIGVPVGVSVLNSVDVNVPVVSQIPEIIPNQGDQSPLPSLDVNSNPQLPLINDQGSMGQNSVDQSSMAPVSMGDMSQGGMVPDNGMSMNRVLRLDQNASNWPKFAKSPNNSWHP